MNVVFVMCLFVGMWVSCGIMLNVVMSMSLIYMLIVSRCS